MAWAIIASVSNGANSSPVITSAINTTGADLIVVCTNTLGGAISFSDSKSNIWSSITIWNSGNPAEIITVYYCQAPTVGSGHTFTWSNADGFGSLAVLAVSGSVVNPLDQQNSFVFPTLGGGDTTLQPGSITPTKNGELLVLFNSIYNDSGAPYSVDSGFITQTLFDATANNFGMMVSTLVQPAAAPINPTWTRTTPGTASGDAAIILSFFPAVATAQGVPFGIIGSFDIEC